MTVLMHLTMWRWDISIRRRELGERRSDMRARL